MDNERRAKAGGSYLGGCLTTLEMQNFVNGGLSETEARAVKKHARNCLRCQGRLKNLRRDAPQAGVTL